MRRTEEKIKESGGRVTKEKTVYASYMWREREEEREEVG